MKKLLLLAICFSFNAEAGILKSKDLQSCISNCVAVHTCEAPKKSAKKPVKKGKKHAKKVQKKSVVKPVIGDEEKEPTKCEPVTEYVYLSNLNDDGNTNSQAQMQLPDMPNAPANNRDYREAVWTRGSFNGPLISPAAYAITNTRDVFVTNTKPYPIKHNRGEVTQTPLPASAWLFVSGLAFLARRKAK